MNIETKVAGTDGGMPPSRPATVKLTVADFLLLKQAGTFAGFSKSELIEGKLIGVAVQGEDEPESDRLEPIKLRVQDYLLLDQAGAFRTWGKTELIEGIVYAVSPQHRPHGFVKDELAYRLRRALETRESPLHVATEQSVAMAPFSEPQPDIILTTAPRGPGAIPVDTVSLLVEVADSTVRFDLGDKARAYAVAGVPEYWVADVNARVIHQMSSPEGEIHAERREVAFGEVVEAMTIMGLKVETEGLT
jgi:Uma2 family endonuclease